jgi:serine protease
MARKSIVSIGFLFPLLFILCISINTHAQILTMDSVVDGENYVAGEIVVKFKPGVSGQQIAEINAHNGAAVLSASRFAAFKRLKVPKGKTVPQMVAIYSRNPNVEYAEPNFIAQAFSAPNDPLYGYQWHMRQINMEKAWDIETGANAVVAVIDTGVAYENYSETLQINRVKTKTVNYAKADDLVGTAFVEGYDFVNNDGHPNDDEGHGTHVAGTIAQSTNNEIGVAGVAYGCSIMPVKVLDGTGSGTYTDIAEGIYFAADKGADVINMSLGGSSPSLTLQNALQTAYTAGVTIVCASGNDGSATAVSYPAAYDDYCIAVGATRFDEAVAYYSNQGASLDLTAPGGDLTVDQNGDGYGDGVVQQTHDGTDYTKFGYYFYQGTSMATPHVSGVAALLVASGLNTPAQVREALQSTAKDKGDAGWDSSFGWGIVDAFAALNYSGVPNAKPVAAAGGPYVGTEEAGVSFDGLASHDFDGDPLTYAWDFGDGTNGSGANPSHVYTKGGSYTVSLVVNDGKVNSAPSQTTATITEVNDPPVADAGPDRTAAVGEPVTLDGSSSFDEEEGALTYTWNFGDGQTGSEMVQTHTYSTAGTYVATLTVTDPEGLTGTDTSMITVSTASTLQMHIASIELGLETRKAGKNSFTRAVATIMVVDGGNSPVEGATVNASWSGATSDIDSGLTGSTGLLILYSDEIKNASGVTFTCSIDHVIKAGWTYDASGTTTASISAP